MSKIQVLSQHIANQIAAGEVVERPASIVKELVENAIDAGASSITVEIRSGGIEYLRVSDNGSGIEADQVPTAFLRHATSKITTAQDLDKIHTLGFRGEALASIAAVSKVELTTRTNQAEAGTKIQISAGEVQWLGPAACPGGTNIIVEDVFFNVPARRKFLKSSRAEAAAIGDILCRAILANPHISFRFLNGGKQIYQSSGDGTLKNAIYCVYGSEVLPHLKPISYKDGSISIRGFLGTEQLARPNRLYQSFYVNGRYIRSQRLSFAVQRAFETRLMSGKFPFFVINLSLPWEAVDVNVHPQKLEVRFQDEDTVFRALTVACRIALGDPVAPLVHGNDLPRFKKERSHFELPAQPLPSADRTSLKEKTEEQQLGTIRERMGIGESSSSQGLSLREGTGTSVVETMPKFPLQQREGQPVSSIPDAGKIESPLSSRNGQDASTATPQVSSQETMGFGMEPYQVIGQLFDCYWVVQQGERVFFIDQHAAHERQIYESIMSGELAGDRQMLLVPAIVKLQPRQFDILMENLPVFAELGFEIEEFGALTVRLCAVPAFIGEDVQGADFLQEAIALLEEQGRVSGTQLKRAALIQASCKGAIKAGQNLAPEEIASLLGAFARQGAPLTCPHGRPVMVQMTKLEFEKMFKRVL